MSAESKKTKKKSKTPTDEKFPLAAIPLAIGMFGNGSLLSFSLQGKYAAVQKLTEGIKEYCINSSDPPEMRTAIWASANVEMSIMTTWRYFIEKAPKDINIFCAVGLQLSMMCLLAPQTVMEKQEILTILEKFFQNKFYADGGHKIQLVNYVSFNPLASAIAGRNKSLVIALIDRGGVG